MPVSVSQFKRRLYGRIHSYVFLILKNKQLLFLLCVFLSHKIVHSIDTSTGQIVSKRRDFTLAWAYSLRICYINISVEMMPKYFQIAFIFQILLMRFENFLYFSLTSYKMFSSFFQFDSKQLFWFHRKFRLWRLTRKNEISGWSMSIYFEWCFVTAWIHAKISVILNSRSLQNMFN